MLWNSDASPISQLDMQALLQHIQNTSTHPLACDSILHCPPSILALLSKCPHILISSAYSILQVYAFSTVSARWRELYTHASILAAVETIREEIHEESGMGNTGLKTPAWVGDVVKMLNVVTIMARAEGRREMIGQLIG